MSLKELKSNIDRIPVEHFLGYFQAVVKDSGRYWNRVMMGGQELLVFRDLEGIYRFFNQSRLVIITRFKLLSLFSTQLHPSALETLPEACLSLPAEALCYLKETSPVDSQFLLPLFFDIKCRLDEAEIPADSPMNSFLINYPRLAASIFWSGDAFSLFQTTGDPVSTVVTFDLCNEERLYGKACLLEINETDSPDLLLVVGANLFFKEKLFLQNDKRLLMVIGRLDSFSLLPVQIPDRNAQIQIRASMTQFGETLALSARLVQEFGFIGAFTLQRSALGMKLQLFDPDLEGMERINWVNQLYALIRQEVFGDHAMEEELTKATFQEVVASDEFFKVNERIIELNFPQEIHFCRKIIDYLLESSGLNVDLQIL